MKHFFTLYLLLLVVSFSYAQRGGQYHRPGNGGYYNHGTYNTHRGHTHRQGPNVNIRINTGGSRCNTGAPRCNNTPPPPRRNCGWRTWTPCCANDFNFVLRRIDAQCFESDRIHVARNLIANYHFSTQQLRRILVLFTFESSRLEIAKFAYHYTCDRGNYPYLYDCFSFRSSVRDLDYYIQCH